MRIDIMNAKIITCLISLIAIISILIFSGCINDESQKSATKEPVELTLELSDFPYNFEIKDRTERLKSDVSQEALDLGWKKGYYIRYARIGDSLLDVTVVEQSISIYPTENLIHVIASPHLNTDDITYEEYSKPNIGDDSRAYRITVKDEFDIEERVYMIEFIKLDVYESFYMSGTTTDYELLKDIAMKAERKIK